jgi:coenzyme F420-0:L-glutamate ligase/coenzyme F420-1:gamma-L-glutamate ligase
MKTMEFFALPGIPEVLPGDDVVAILTATLEGAGLSLQQGDLLVIAQKIISKAENRYIFLDEVTPGARALALAPQCEKDPRLVELILQESDEVMRVRPGVIVVQHKRGYVHANAGIDKSNLPSSARERVLRLPVDADASAEKIRSRLSERFGVEIGVIINDSAGRAWRTGAIGFAIGTAGFEPLVDMIGTPDRFGRVMEVTQVAVADELAAAASHLMGQAAEGQPVVLIRGASVRLGSYSSSSLIRNRQLDLFR